MSTSRTKKAFFNIIAGFSEEIVALVCGLILPRLVLKTFGSAYNGITSSITQFISVISLMKAGIGGVTRAALYKPLADRDYKGISIIVNQTQHFMRRIAVIFVLFALVFSVIYPLFINDEFDFWFTSTLILIISLSTFSQYYFGLTAQMVLNADQKQYITAVFNIIFTILNTVVSVVLIRLGASIHIVKLGSSIVFVIHPIIVNAYVKRCYSIDKKVSSSVDTITQRWDAVGHEVANFVNNNTDVMILTVLTTYSEVSVYTVYHYVLYSIRKVLNTCITGFGAAFGNMYALKQYKLIDENLKIYELIVFSLTSVIYSVSLVMLTPFVMIYTSDVTDADYFRPLFGIVLTLASTFGCYKTPYETVAKALGHYKQTRNASFLEAGLNLVISIVCVFRFGLIGVAMGTLIAMAYRFFAYSYYVSRKILNRKYFQVIKHLLVAMGINAATYGLSLLYIPTKFTVLVWIVYAAITTLIAVAMTLTADFLFFKHDMMKFIQKVKSSFSKRSIFHG